MYLRITTFHMKTDRFDDAMALAERLKPEIMAIPGLKYWFDAGNEDGSFAVVAIYESEAAAEAAKLPASVIFGQFAEYFKTQPQPRGYPVLLHGVNA